MQRGRTCGTECDKSGTGNAIIKRVLESVTILSCHRGGKLSVRISIVRSEKIEFLAFFLLKLARAIRFLLQIYGFSLYAVLF